MSLLWWVLFSVSMAVIAPLLKRGGAAYEEEGRTVFPLRPGMKVVSVLLLAMGLGMLRFSFTGEAGENRTALFFFIPIGVLMCLGAVYSLSTSYSVDAKGIHFHFLGRTTTIAWDDLDHFERLVQGPSAQILFRSKGGSTIGIDGLGQDASGFLALVQSRHSLKERPYIKPSLFRR